MDQRHGIRLAPRGWLTVSTFVLALSLILSGAAGPSLTEVAGAATIAPEADQTDARADAGIIIAVDPGHGGPETGAIHYNRSGRADLVEKDVNLAIALRVEELLWYHGYVPVLTRRSDRRVNVPAWDRTGDGIVDINDDLQARVDIANEAGADLLIPIHNNGHGCPSVRGTSSWYCEDHPRGWESAQVAALLQASFRDRLQEAGYRQVVDWGPNDDAALGKPYGHLFLVGPETPRVARGSQMPTVLGESLFVTNHWEAALLQDPGILDAIASAYVDAVRAYFEG